MFLGNTRASLSGRPPALPAGLFTGLPGTTNLLHCCLFHLTPNKYTCSNLIKIGKIIFARDTCTCKIQTNSRDIENDLPQGWQGSLGSGEVQTGKNYCVFFGGKNHKQSSQPSSDRDRRVVISLVKVLLWAFNAQLGGMFHAGPRLTI